jgi:hypothetical protein
MWWTDAGFLDAIKIFGTLIGGIISFLIGRFFLSTREKYLVENQQFQHSYQVEKELMPIFTEFLNVSNEAKLYIESGNSEGCNDLYLRYNAIAEKYVQHILMMANLVLSKKLVHKQWVDTHKNNINIDIIKQYYDTSNQLAEKCGIREQKFDEKMYANIIKVVKG